MSIKTILIDDEPLAIAELKLLLEKHKNIEVVSTAEDFLGAKKKLKTLKPDLIFLDINLPEKNGFELLQELDDIPHVIFVTAYDQYAVEAFETNALDYILKPVNPQRLADALSKAEKAIKSELHPPQSSKNHISPEKRIFIKDGEKCYFVPVSEIVLIESVGNYSKVFYKNIRPLLHRSLSHLDERLPDQLFFRANRQQIINFNHIRNIHPFFNSTLRLEMTNGINVDLSQRQTVKFKEITGI